MLLERLDGLLHQCSINRGFKYGLSLHAMIIKMGFQFDLYLCNHLINMYAKCNALGVARQIFNAMPNRNLVSWSALISGYAQANKSFEAIKVFSKMRLQPNEYIYASVISACASCSALALGQQVHAHSFKTGYNHISFVSNSLLSMYMKCGLFDDALSIFSCISERNSVSYNAMITGFAENQQPEKGLMLLKRMKRDGLHLDQFSFVASLGVCSNKGDLEVGLCFHCQTIKLGFDTSAFVGNVIMNMYSKFNNNIEEVQKAFQSINRKDVISWNTFIVACSEFGDHLKALMVYRKMQNVMDVSPDDFTFTGALTACTELASICHGTQIHAHLIRHRLDFDVGVGNALINMYAKCGLIGYAVRLFHHMHNMNLVTWNTMIVGLGNHGHGRMALEIFEQMKACAVSPDCATFVGVLTACTHAGLVDIGLFYFNSMKDTYGISPKLEHLSCLVDMLGRAGRMEEAEEYLNMFSFGNDAVILGSLLSSCRIHKDVRIGEQVAKRLLELEPTTSSPYVLLANLYASDGRWGDVAEAWKKLKSGGLKKVPGESMIQVEGTMKKFTMGDFSHSRINEIIEMLGTLNFEAKEFSL